jgi:hypothetical protein
MRRIMSFRIAALSGCATLLLSLPGLPTVAEEPKEKDAEPAAPQPKHTTLVKNPKPLSVQAKKALDFLVKQQQPNGGWTSGPSAAMWEGGLRGIGGVKDGFDAANTSIAALALLRAGYSPKQGPYSDNLRKAIHGVLKSVEDSDKDSLNLATTRGTQIQRKIGDNVDTYLAAILLATAKGTMPDAKSEARLVAGLQKIVDKMEKNQKDNGTWQGEGWAPVLSQAMASRAINMAKQAGMTVDNDKLEKTAQHAKESFKQVVDGNGRSGLAAGNAGVDLYSAAAIISAMQDAVHTNRALSDASKSVMRSPAATDRDRDSAKRQLARLDEHENALREALRVISKKIQDGRFVNGFGSDGGEEFISFSLIAEALLANQMKEFGEWDKAMGNRLINSQNATGGWSGKHCISGETFCTATALMTMMADRAFKPIGSEMVSRIDPVRPPEPKTEVTKKTEPKAVDPKSGDVTRNDLPEGKQPTPAAVENSVTDAEQLLRDLMSEEADRTAILAKLRDGKGSDYTDALARAAAKLRGEEQKEAREALANRLFRMKADTLRKMLQDEYTEIRRGAIFACAMKEEKSLVPDLIPLLADSDPLISRSARTALKSLSGQDFGPEPDANAGDKTKAILAWKSWWAKQGNR